MNIRPISDLRNHYSEVELDVLESGPVFLTKNGYGSDRCSIKRTESVLYLITGSKSVTTWFFYVVFDDVMEIFPPTGFILWTCGFHYRSVICKWLSIVYNNPT